MCKSVTTVVNEEGTEVTASQIEEVALHYIDFDVKKQKDRSKYLDAKVTITYFVKVYLGHRQESQKTYQNDRELSGLT